MIAIEKSKQRFEQEKIYSSTPIQTMTYISSISKKITDKQDIFIPKNTDKTFITLTEYSQNLDIDLYDEDCKNFIKKPDVINSGSQQFILDDYNGKKLCVKIKNNSTTDDSYKLHTQNLNTFRIYTNLLAKRSVEALIKKGVASLFSDNKNYSKSTRVASNLIVSKLLYRKSKNMIRSILIDEIRTEMTDEFGLGFLGLIMGDLYVEIFEEAHRYR